MTGDGEGVDAWERICGVLDATCNAIETALYRVISAVEAFWESLYEELRAAYVLAVGREPESLEVVMGWVDEMGRNSVEAWREYHIEERRWVVNSTVAARRGLPIPPPPPEPPGCLSLGGKG